MKKYFIREDIPLTILSKHGFVERENGWYRDYHNHYMTFIDSHTREIWKVDYEYSYLQSMYYRGSKYLLNDLFENNLIKEEAI